MMFGSGINRVKSFMIIELVRSIVSFSLELASIERKSDVVYTNLYF